MKGYPDWFSARFISMTMGLLFSTGLLLVPTTLYTKLDWEVPWRLTSNSLIFTAALHALCAFVTLFILGALSSIHMRQEWKRGKNRLSALILIAVFVFLSLSSLGIYYFGDDQWSSFSSLSHLIVGILFLFIYIWHIFKKSS